MAGTVGFFNPSEQLGLDASWELQSEAPSSTSQRASGLGSDGDEAASKLYDPKTAITCKFKCFSASGDLTVPPAGTVTAGGFHIDSWTVTYSPTDWPSISVTAHKHTGTTGTHGVGDCRTYTPSVDLPAGWGISRTVAGWALAEGDTAIGIASAEYSISVTHQDELGEAGEWLAGENRDGAETFKLGLTGAGATVTAPAGWDKLEDGTAKSNQAADTQSLSWEHHVAFDVVSP